MNNDFLAYMQDLLGEEYSQFIDYIDGSPLRGIRINPRKIDDEAFFDMVDVPHHASNFAKHMYYLESDVSIEKMPAYQAGLFYMQEPSASSAVTILDPKPGETILDLCAAPGSKTTQIANLMQDEGLLIANEIHPNRAKILVENIERQGVINCVVTNTDTKNIAKALPNYFDKILCDAPCSGEGMFRKEKDVLDNWSLDNAHFCAKRQLEILENAYICLKPGGKLVYSTCTYNKIENEDVISSFLEKHEDMTLLPIDVSFGRSGFDQEGYTRRIFPMDEGEGHFIALLQKDIRDYHSPSLKVMKSDESANKIVKTFMLDTLQVQYPYTYVYKGNVFVGVNPFYDLSSLHVLRHQVKAGTIKGNLFIPSHHFFLSTYSPFLHQYALDEEEVKQYLRGEQLSIQYDKGWVAMCYHGYPVGGAKSDGNALKNKFPKTYRLR